MIYENKLFISGFIQALTMIWITEIGDKTFFIATFLAMQHEFVLVFIGAFGALTLMTILSTLFGNIVPHLISTNFTNFVAVISFFFFGIKMFQEAYYHEMEDKKSDQPNAMIEAQESIGEKKKDIILREKKIDCLFYIFSPILIQSFTLTFLAEWGDRSQLATITLSIAHNPFAVTLGAIIGHFMCTGIAVIGGKMISHKISSKTMNYFGAILFFLFAFVILYQEEISSG